MALRPCLGCGKPSPKTRCPDCARVIERNRAQRPTNVGRGRKDQQRRARVVAEHRAIHGDWCPGWQRPAHAATDLTADHPIAVANGGDPNGQLNVLCRSCNGAKGRRPGGAPPTGP